MNPLGTRIVVWVKSRYSNLADNCVEWTRTDDGVLVRDSKNPGGPVMSLTLDQWRTFLDRLRDADIVDLGFLRISTETTVVAGTCGPVAAVWHLRDVSGTVLRFTAGERDAFLREVRDHGHERTLAA